MSRLIRPQDARMKSPFTYSDDDIFPVDYAKQLSEEYWGGLRRKSFLRAAKLAKSQSVTDRLIDALLWMLVAGFVYWMWRLFR